MKIKRSFLSLLLCASMVLSICPQMVMAANAPDTGLCEHVQEMINALPVLTDMERMNDDDLQAAIEQYSAAYEAYELLSDEQKGQITGAEVLDEFVMLMNASVPLTGNISYLDYDNGNWSTCEVAEYTEINTDNMPTTWTEGWYVVNGNVTISDVVTVSGAVSLILTDSSILTCSQGIVVSGDNSLTIYGQNGGTGTLNATGRAGYPGIGEGVDEVGTIVINGGVINATGSPYKYSGGLGSGIGGTSNIYSALTTGGTVIINGGTVTATGSSKWDGLYRTVQGIYAESFTTGTNGNAVIKTNGISDVSHRESWSGIIYEGNAIGVYGNQMLSTDLTVEKGYTLEISSGAKLTVPTGITLTNNGTLLVVGTLVSAGTLENNDTLTVESTGSVNGTGKLINTKNVEISGSVSCSSINNSSLIEINENGKLICNGGMNTGIIYNKGALINNGTISGEGGVIFSTSDVNGADSQIIKDSYYLNKQGEIAYISGDCALVPATATASTWQKVDGKTTWYIAIGNVTIDNGVTLSDDINLLLMDGATLTVKGRNENGGINANGHILNIYAQSNGSQMGTLVASGGHYNWMAIGGSDSNVNIYGGLIEAGFIEDSYSGIGAGIYRKSKEITILRGLIRTKSIGNGNTVGTGTGGLYAPEGSNAIVYTNQTDAGNASSTFHGILFLQNAGTVYGNQELAMDLTIEEGEVLTVPADTTWIIPKEVTLTVKGELIVEGILENNGTVQNSGTITNNGEVRINAGSTYTGTDPANRGLSYQICWDIDGNGAADDTTYVLSGETPTHTDGSKEPTVDTVYTFIGWSPTLTAASEPAAYTAQFSDSTRTYTVTLPTSPVGYTVSSDNGTTLNYNSVFTFKVNLAEGYSATDSFAVKANGTTLTQSTDGTYSVTIQSDTAITVDGVADITVPDGDIKIKENSVKKFINAVSFGLFFKENVDVTINASDAGSGVKSIEYFRSGVILSEDEVAAITGWTTYTEPIAEMARDTEKFIYYVKVTDNADNVTCFASDGATFDLTDPVISGVTNGETYYTTQKVTVTETNLESVTVNGKQLSLDKNGALTLAGNTDTSYTIVVADKVGNETTVTVTMKTTGSLVEALGDITQDNATSADCETVQEYLNDLKERLTDENLTGEEKTILEKLANDAQDILDRLDEAEQAGSTESIKQVQDITTDNVTLEDKSTLEQAKEDIQQALDEFGGNYTDEEKVMFEETLKRIEEALEVIERVENAEAAIEALPDTVSPDDTEAEKQIGAAKEQYDALSEYEKSLIPIETEKKLESLLVDLGAYRIIEGHGSTWIPNSDGGLTFTTNGAFSKFAGIEVDGKIVDAANYTAASGSTVITLKAEYLNTLTAGEHTITVLYTNGEATGTFTIAEETSVPAGSDQTGNEDNSDTGKTDIPQTGDNSSITLWIATLLISGAVLTGTALYRRKRKYNR